MDPNLEFLVFVFVLCMMFSACVIWIDHSFSSRKNKKDE